MASLLRRLFHALSFLPLWLLQAMGAALGWLTFALSPGYRQRFRDNARCAGVPLGQARPAIAGAGRMLMELPYLWLRPASQAAASKLFWDGVPLVEAALAQGRGLILLTPHMGCFEVTAQGIAERFGARHPITVLYRPARKPWLREIVATSRVRPGLAVAPATLGGVRQMIRALRRGHIVGLLPDQVPPLGMGTWAPFFGQAAYTMTLAARLAQQTGAALLLTWGERLPHGRGYRLHFLPFDEALPEAAGGSAQAQAESATAAACAVNRAMERLILQCPGQYLWGYHRYKHPRRAADADADLPLPPGAEKDN